MSSAMKYTVVIKYLGRYYVQKESKNSCKFEFPTFNLVSNRNYSAKDFVQTNINIKKEIVAQIIHNTPFRNSKWTGENAYKAISLQKLRAKDDQNRAKRIKLVIFTCNELRNDKKNEFVPYFSDIKEWCTPATKKIIGRLKVHNNWSTYLFYGFLGLMCILCFLPGVELPFNTDALPFIYSALGGIVSIVLKFIPTNRYLEKYSNCPFLGNIPLLSFLLFVGLLIISCRCSFLVPDTWNPLLSKVGLLVLVIESAIEVYQRDM